MVKFDNLIIPKLSSLSCNYLLANLSSTTYERLVPHLNSVNLKLGQILNEPNETFTNVYFPNQATISLVSLMEDGATTEIGSVGNEGMLGIPVILGGLSTTNRAIVQIEGTAIMMNAEMLIKEFQQSSELQRLLLLYTQVLLTQISQCAACNRQHTIEERLSRWLLSTHDRVQQKELGLTQEFIANMLGIRRSGVTVAVNLLQEAGMIHHSRGKITILNRRKLENSACECYRIIKKENNRLLLLGKNLF